jgi:hypothetical protein
MEGTAGCCGLFCVLVFLAVPNEPTGLKFISKIYSKINSLVKEY